MVYRVQYEHDQIEEREEQEGKINKQTAEKSETTRPQKRIASTSNEIAVRSETDE